MSNALDHSLHGPQRTPQTWVDLFVQRTDEQAERLYATDLHSHLSYGDLRQSVDRLATFLLERGVRPGQTLAIWMTNSIEFLVAQWATYRVGCALLPLYSYYREIELVHGLSETKAPVLFTSREFGGKVDPLTILSQVCPNTLNGGIDEALPELTTIIVMDDGPAIGTCIPFRATQENSPNSSALEWVRGRLSPFDAMNVMYTSGTTGTPKAGVSMHSNNLASIASWNAVADLTPDDVLLAQVPMFTNFGCLYVNGLALFAGASIVISRTFDAAFSLRSVRELGVTYLPGSPEIMRMLLQHPDFAATDFSAVRAAHVAGSAADPELLERLIDEIATNVIQAYGMSECGGVSTLSSQSDSRDKRLTTVGRAIPSCRIRIVDPNSLESCPDGTVGEIWFADASPGSCVGRGYAFSPTATSAAVRPDGWFRSGDLGSLDSDGYLTFTGRLKNMITVGGFNVYPAEIERHLNEIPGVAAAFVVGIEDERLGMVPVAFVVREPESTVTEASLIQHMRNALSSQKRPRAIWFIEDSDLPLTPSGKVRIADLQSLASSRSL